MKARLYTPDDYPMVCKWWESWGWPCIPEESLPSIGVVIESDNTPVSAAWIYRTDSNMCLLEWFISSKETTKQQRKGSVEALIKASTEMAKSLGFSRVFCSVRNANLMKKLENSGFAKTENEMTNYIGVV